MRDSDGDEVVVRPFMDGVCIEVQHRTGVATFRTVEDAERLIKKIRKAIKENK